MVMVGHIKPASLGSPISITHESKVIKEKQKFF
jgi:hypothetical protein